MFPDTTTSPVERFELATSDVDRAHEARRWGWANPSHFATAYREAYGQCPRHTLRT